MGANPNDPKETSRKPKIDDEWLKGLYSQVGREVSTARQSQQGTHNWVIAIVTGSLAAVWAIGDGEFRYPTETSFIAVLAILPLIFRFFVRSCLEYQILNRWLEIRNALDVYFFAKDMGPEMKSRAKKGLIESVRLYYFQWKQPKSMPKMIWDNFQLAYGWPSILILGLLTWGTVVQVMTKAICIALSIVVSWMAFELWNFIRYFSGEYEIPTSRIDPRSL